MSRLSDRISALTPEQRQLLHHRLGRSAPRGAGGTIPRRERPDAPAPLGFEQERLWLVQRIFPHNAAYNITNAIRPDGHLDLPALAWSLAEVVRRHEALRTRFPDRSGRPVQVVDPPARMALAMIDSTSLPIGRRTAAVRAASLEFARRPYDLARDHPIRALVARSGESENRLYVTIHHIATDWWSFDLFWRELVELYQDRRAGRTPALPPLPIQYADFAAWQRRRVETGELDADIEYWRSRLGGAPDVLELPADRPRPAEADLRGGRWGFDLEPGTGAAVEALARCEGATSFVVLLAAFAVLLSRSSRQEDLLIGAPVADRTPVETEVLIGYFLNLLVLRVDVSSAPTFREVVRRARQTVVEAFAHQEVPFSRLLDEIRPGRNLGVSALFQAVFIYIAPRREGEEDRFTPRRAEEGPSWDPGTSRFDLTLVAERRWGRLRLFFEYRSQIFDRTTVARTGGHLGSLLAGAGEDPDLPVAALPLLSGAERHAALLEANDGRASAPSSTCLHGLFEATAARMPDAVAVASPEGEWSFGALRCRAYRVAAALAEAGVGPNDRVGLLLDRSPGLVAALLGVLAAGGAYVPLDPGHPEERLRRVLEVADPVALVSRTGAPGRVARSLAGGRPLILVDAALPPPARQPSRPPPEALAWVFFTSGTSGRPKGVAVQHAHAVAFLHAALRRPGLSPEDVVLSMTAPTFDPSVLETFLPLATGARMALLPEGPAADGARVAAALADTRATLLQATPVSWLLLLDGGWEGDSRLTALCGGERMGRDLAERLVPRVGALWNLYGPTETTVWATAHRVAIAPGPAAGAVSLGRPLGQNRVYVLDRWLAPAARNVPGEIHVGGLQVAIGYLGRPALTAEAFLPDPWSPAPGGRMYRTGDLARRRRGVLEFLGRLDLQVKVRGFRVELEDVEAALEEHSAVAEAVARVVGDQPGERRFAAYLVPADGGRADPASTGEVLAWVRGKVPHYMVPSAIVWMEELPRTSRGKIDRRALPEPGTSRPGLSVPWEPPGSRMEREVARIWGEVLSVDRVGRHDSFFDLGGHSILLFEVQRALHAQLERDVPITALFRHPTVHALAGFLTSGGSDGPGGEPVEGRRRRGRHRRDRMHDRRRRRHGKDPRGPSRD